MEQAQSVNPSQSNTIENTNIILNEAVGNSQIISQIQSRDEQIVDSTKKQIEDDDECPATNLDKIRNNKIKNNNLKQTGFIKHRNDPYKYSQRKLQDNPDGIGFSLAEEAEKAEAKKLESLREDGYGRFFYAPQKVTYENLYLKAGKTYEQLYEYYKAPNQYNEKGYFSPVYKITYYDGYGYNYYNGAYGYYEYSRPPINIGTDVQWSFFKFAQVFIGLVLFLVSYSMLYYYVETKSPKIENVEIGVMKPNDQDTKDREEQAQRQRDNEQMFGK